MEVVLRRKVITQLAFSGLVIVEKINIMEYVIYKFFILFLFTMINIYIGYKVGLREGRKEIKK